MALSKETLKSDIKTAFTGVMNQADDKREDALDKLADKIADAVIKSIKSMQITYTAGLAAPMGPVTGQFQYTIS